MIALVRDWLMDLSLLREALIINYSLRISSDQHKLPHPTQPTNNSKPNIRNVSDTIYISLDDNFTSFVQVDCDSQLIIYILNSNRQPSMRSKKAVPFIIKNDQTNSYHITPEAKQLLQGIDQEVTVVSVAGLYRTGKSYLLNKVIIDKKGVFGVGPTVNPCTKGLWLWAEPDPTRQNRTMLIIDTEGLGALDQQSNHDMKIFCLAVLLSTTFIYNSVGSIDENALQTLSLVLNIVNSIDQQQNSSRPQFIWVVRDFSLQLIDESGNYLTSNEYLEMALTSNAKQPQKSMIRKTIMDAFNQRECFTLVKPLIDESKLQNLDEIPIEELRPEFVSQSIQLRNKIKTTLKEFRLCNTSKLIGRDYALVAEKYVKAINEGAVPNMMDTWAYIKDEKSRQAMEEIHKIYTEKVKTKVLSKIPTKKSIIEEQMKIMRDDVRAHYLKITYDETSTEPVDELFQNLYRQVLKHNEEEAKIFLKNSLNKEYQPYAKKLYSQYYAHYEEFEKELTRGFKESVMHKCGDRVDDINDAIDRFTQQKLTDNFKLFEKRLKDQIARLTNIKGEVEETMQKQISQINESREQERRTQKDRIFDLQKKIKLMEAERQQISENVKVEKDLAEGNCQILKRKTQELQLMNEQLSREVSILSAGKNELKEKLFLDSKEYQKEKALFAQKEDYMSRRIQQLESKSSELERTINETGGNFEHEKKSLINSYQDKVRYLEAENKRLEEMKLDAEFKMNRARDESKQILEQMNALKARSMQDKRELQSRINEAESNKKLSKIENELKSENQELVNQLERLNEKNSQISKKVKQLQDQLKFQQNNSQKQIAVHVQQIQFQQLQIKDLNQRYDELKKSYQNALENFQDNSKSNEQSIQMKVYELTSEHQRQIKALEVEHEEKIKSLKKEIQMLQRHKEETNLQHALDRKQAENKDKQWKETNNLLQAMVKKLEEKIQSSEKNYEDISKEKETFYSHRIKQLEQEIDQVKERSSQEVSQNSKKSEEALTVLKQYSEMEKQQWQKRLKDQKEKSDRRQKNMREQFDKKLQEQKALLEEQISELQDRLAHMDRIYNEKLQNLQYDHDIQVQKLSNSLIDERSKYSKEIALANQNLQFTKNSHDKEMKQKTRQFRETLEATQATIRAEFEESIKKLSEQKALLEQKYDSLKKNSRQLEQNCLLLRNELDKERLVIKEKQKNFERKIQQVEDRLQSQLISYNKVIENINEKNHLERERLNQEIEKRNRNIVDLQEQKNRIETDYEAEKVNYESKIRYYLAAKEKNKEDYDDMMKKFESTVKTLSKERDKYKDKNSKEFQVLADEHEKEIRAMQEDYNQMVKKMKKDQDDRIVRLTVENRSLKDRIANLEIERSETVKKTQKEEREYDRMDAKYQKRMEEYKQLLRLEKENSRKLRDQITRLKVEHSDMSNVSAHSIYQQRPSISEISNSRLYNQTHTEMKRKFTNTPLISKKRRVVDVEQFGGVSRFNEKTNERRY